MRTYDLTEFEDPMEDVFWGDTFTKVTEETIEDQDRWHTYLYQVLQHNETGEYWGAEWRVGSTEYQECDHDLILTQVEPREVTVIQYFIVE